MVAHLFDERDGAVEKMVTIAIEAAQRAGKKIGICGQRLQIILSSLVSWLRKGLPRFRLTPIQCANHSRDSRGGKGN